MDPKSVCSSHNSWTDLSLAQVAMVRVGEVCSLVRGPESWYSCLTAVHWDRSSFWEQLALGRAGGKEDSSLSKRTLLDLGGGLSPLGGVCWFRYHFRGCTCKGYKGMVWK